MSMKYNLRDYSEIFSYGTASIEKGKQNLQKLIDTNDYTVKITSTSFLMHDQIMSPKTFPWEIFDKIILAEREDTAQQIASWMLLSHAQLTGHLQHDSVVKYLTQELQNVENIPFREHEFEQAIKSINYFYKDIKDSLIKFDSKVKMVKYELLQKHPAEYVDELNGILDTNFSITDLSGAAAKTELDYTPFIDYYTLREKIHATKEENNTRE